MYNIQHLSLHFLFLLFSSLSFSFLHHAWTSRLRERETVSLRERDAENGEKKMKKKMTMIMK
jgi:hypothetical protein